MAQTAVPGSTVSAVVWTSSISAPNIHLDIDEGVDFAETAGYAAHFAAGGDGNAARFTMINLAGGSILDPITHTGHSVRVYAKRGGSAVALDVSLYQGAAGPLIATGSFVLTTTNTMYAVNLTAAEAAAITNYNDLQVTIAKRGTANTLVQVHAVDLVLPSPQLVGASTGVATCSGNLTGIGRLAGAELRRNVLPLTNDGFPDGSDGTTSHDVAGYTPDGRHIYDKYFVGYLYGMNNGNNPGDPPEGFDKPSQRVIPRPDIPDPLGLGTHFWEVVRSDAAVVDPGGVRLQFAGADNGVDPTKWKHPTGRWQQKTCLSIYVHEASTAPRGLIDCTNRQGGFPQITWGCAYYMPGDGTIEVTPREAGALLDGSGNDPHGRPHEDTIHTVGFELVNPLAPVGERIWRVWVGIEDPWIYETVAFVPQPKFSIWEGGPDGDINTVGLTQLFLWPQNPDEAYATGLGALWFGPQWEVGRTTPSAYQPIEGNLWGAGSVFSGTLNGVLELSGTANGVATTSGDLISAGTGVLEGTASGFATTGGALTGRGRLVGTASGVATASGELTDGGAPHNPGAMSGTANGNASCSGTLTGRGRLAGTSSGVATVSAGATTTSSISGTASGSATCSGTLIGTGSMIARSFGWGSASGTLTPLALMSGTASGAATCGGSGLAVGFIGGSTAGVGSASGALGGVAVLQGVSRGWGTASGFLGAVGRLAGTASGAATCSGSGDALAAMSGTASGAASTSGTLAGLGSLAGASGGAAAALGALTGLGALKGAASGVGAAEGTLAGEGVLAGSASGSATVSGTLAGFAPPGAAFGVASCSGALTALGALSGTSYGGASASATIEDSVLGCYGLTIHALERLFYDEVTIAHVLPTQRENYALTDPPKDSPWANFVVIFDEIEPAPTGTRRRIYRKVGHAKATLFTPLGMGDSYALELADLVKSTFRSRDLGNGVWTHAPGIGARRVFADTWWAVDVLIPFWGRCSLLPAPTEPAPLNPGDWSVTATSVRTRFRERVETPMGLVVLHGNTRDEEPEGRFVRFDVVSGRATPISSGLYRTPGVVYLGVNVPINSGTRDAIAVVDRTFHEFAGIEDRGVHYRAPQLHGDQAPSALGRDGSSWQMTITIPFWSDQHG